MKMLFAIAGLFLVAASSWSQNVEEIVVTGARTEEGVAMPGTFLRKTGDYLLLQVNVTNDTREAQADAPTAALRPEDSAADPSPRPMIRVYGSRVDVGSNPDNSKHKR